MAKAFYIKQAGKVSGPFSSSQVKKGISSGKVKGDALIGQSKDGPWHPIEKVIARSVDTAMKPIAPIGVEPETPAAVTPQPIIQPQPIVQPVISQAAAPQVTQVVVNQQPSNAVGMVGFVLSIVSWFTCGLLFPLALLFSFIGIFYKPRGFAVAGLCISGGAAAFLAICWFLFLGAMLTGAGALGMAFDQVQTAIDRTEISNAVHSFYLEHERLPTVEEVADISTIGISMPEGFRYKPLEGSTAELSHWGEDRVFDTLDDEVYEVDFSNYRLDDSAGGQ